MPILPPTCGLIITSPAGWLLAHVTTTPFWDLPKGKANPGEVPVVAALRECQEETGLDFSPYRDRLRHLGMAPYNLKRGKRLVLFRLDLSEAFDLSACVCSSWVHTRGPRPVLEMDAFAWVPEAEVRAWVNPRLAQHLTDRGLFD
jgi:8-oxo-dGTP pyrophosphatase MutT (NUDIX family)